MLFKIHTGQVLQTTCCYSLRLKSSPESDPLTSLRLSIQTSLIFLLRLTLLQGFFTQTYTCSSHRIMLLAMFMFILISSIHVDVASQCYELNEEGGPRAYVHVY